MVGRAGLGWRDGPDSECLTLHMCPARAELVLEGYSERHSLKPRATDQASICDELGGRGTCCRQHSVLNTLSLRIIQYIMPSFGQPPRKHHKLILVYDVCLGLLMMLQRKGVDL